MPRATLTEHSNNSNVQVVRACVPDYRCLRGSSPIYLVRYFVLVSAITSICSDGCRDQKLSHLQSEAMVCYSCRDHKLWQLIPRHWPSHPRSMELGPGHILFTFWRKFETCWSVCFSIFLNCSCIYSTNNQHAWVLLYIFYFFIFYDFG